MTISSLDSSPESRKFSFASPIQEILRHDTSLDASMILDDEKDETRRDVDEDKVDSLNDSRDNNDDEYRDDNLEGFREDNIDNYGDVEEDKEPGKDIKPEPPPQPPLYRPSRPPHSGLKRGVRVVPINFGLGWIENGWKWLVTHSIARIRGVCQKKIGKN